ncbi:hypothetical protein NQ317_013190 [Molorchus minor]|uniref:C2H2-type domain-containing protein n=1 Tax=Molorchus minor TaxID=1323400 RepID=A0ABQ9J2P9_9CUCU|nr:hypothetical protein NQ317_013190 [Molorchus minor]
MSTMQSSPDLICVDCNDKFESAALLLCHFAKHVEEFLETQPIPARTDLTDKKNRIPNLYPIKKRSRMNTNDTDKSSDSGIEDIYPLNMCLVTMEENICTIANTQRLNKECERPFKCHHCSFSFTRKFLLQKHQRKYHALEFSKTKLPDLKPINVVDYKKESKSNKKTEIKHQISSIDDCKTNFFKCDINSVLCFS